MVKPIETIFIIVREVLNMSAFMFSNRLEKELHITKPEDWYHIERKEVVERGGRGFLSHVCREREERGEGGETKEEREERAKRNNYFV